MSRILFSVLLIFSSVHFSVQRSTPSDDSYVAAALEYAFTNNVTENLENYVAYTAEAATQGADIIVFPEMTLTRGAEAVTVPIHGFLQLYRVPADYPTLYHEILVTMSEAARTNQIYILINVQEFLNCSSPIDAAGELCPEQEVYLFNTNVVFDRDGAVIDRYRKINLFGEFTRTPALAPDLGVFTTDFGVTFGHYICFDLMFQVPAVQVVNQKNVTDVLFSTMWFSELPFLTAVQIQEAYAYSMNVNFVAAGANNVGVGSAGSGIYSGKEGSLISTMPGLATSRLLVARVPKVPGQVIANANNPGPIYDPPSDHDSLVLITDPSLPSYVSRRLVPGEQTVELQDGTVSCSFRIKMTSGTGTSVYQYRAMAFDGIRSFSGLGTGGTRTCGVVACTGDTIDTCGKRFEVFSSGSTAHFEELVVISTVPTPSINETLEAYDSAYFPVASLTSIMPLEPSEFTYEVSTDGDNTVYRLSLVNHEAELYTFAVWGRLYAPDGEEATPPREHDVPDSASSLILNSMLLISCIFASRFV